jgi:hypothetical protein
MVHYDPDVRSAVPQALPRVSPEERAAAANDVAAELKAIRAMGKALTALDDPAGRRRVLNWALERFGGAELPQLQPAAVMPAQDPLLRVDNLDDLFGPSAPRVDAAAPVHHVDDVDNVDDVYQAGHVMHMDRVAVVERTAMAHGDDDGQLDDLFEPVAACQQVDNVFEPVARGYRVSDALAPVTACQPIDGVVALSAADSNDLPAVVREEPAFDEMVRDFISDFRRLTAELQSAAPLPSVATT